MVCSSSMYCRASASSWTSCGSRALFASSSSQNRLMVASEILPAARRSVSVPAAFSSVAIKSRSLTTSACSLSNEARAAASFCAALRRLSARRSRSALVAVSGSKLAIASDTRSPSTPKCFEIKRAVKPQPFELFIAIPFISWTTCGCSLDEQPFLLQRYADDEVDMDTASGSVAVHAGQNGRRDQQVFVAAAAQLAHVGNEINVLAQAALAGRVVDTGFAAGIGRQEGEVDRRRRASSRGRRRRRTPAASRRRRGRWRPA